MTATNLSGNLDTFRLDEVLSLLGMGGRTARLRVSGPAGEGLVHLVDGEVSSATADRSRAGLLRQVVAAAGVGAADLAGALDHDDPVRALVDGGAVDRSETQRLAAEHAVDALAELLTRTEGEFAVWVGQDDAGDLGLRIPVAEAVERGRARVAEWQRLRAELPGEDAVLVMASRPHDAPTLAVDEWAVLARIDGRRTLGEVVAAAGCAPLVASDRIVALLGRGLVEVRDSHAESTPDVVGAMIDSYEGGTGRSVTSADPVASSLVEPSDWQAVETTAPALRLPGVASLADAGGPVEVADPEAGPDGMADPVGSGDPVGVADPVAVVDPVWVAEPLEFAGSVAVADPAEAPTEVVRCDVIPFEPPATTETGAASEVPVLLAAADPMPAADPIAAADPIRAAAPATEASAPAGARVPIAPAVEWSPWAQALGLSAPAPAGELIVDPLAGRGIAQRIADAAGLSDIEHAPVPVPPSALDGLVGSWSEQLDADPDPDDLDEVPTTVIHDLDVDMPGPRTPSDDAPVSEAGSGDATAAADPLAGGLLSELISGVRGL